MAIKRCDGCGDIYNQQEKETYCWSCRVQKKHLPETVTLIWAEEETGNKKVVRVVKKENAVAEHVEKVKQEYNNVWTEVKWIY